ncbi:glycosyltransferase [Paraburkholderia nemoris]|uniref:glycosyltransferase family 32 protein n=1 Tax=Paraburkholderia nemoris TaxID=2793076 RepID=UPI0038BAD824
MEDTPEDHRRRSDFVRLFIQRHVCTYTISDSRERKVPKTIVQFWHAKDQIPSDVANCMESWERLAHNGLRYLLFDRRDARDFIRQKLGDRYSAAFDLCYHPAMLSDYFRLCFMLTEGGFYVDADDVYAGGNVENLFSDGRLKLQPLCYDIATDSMVSPSVFADVLNHSPDWIYYVNNNPLIAPPQHPVISKALEAATSQLEHAAERALPEIQSTTGPGILTKSLFELAQGQPGIDLNVGIMWDWDAVGSTKWHLSYRNDSRNWRLSNQQHSDLE